MSVYMYLYNIISLYIYIMYINVLYNIVHTPNVSINTRLYYTGTWEDHEELTQEIKK